MDHRKIVDNTNNNAQLAKLADEAREAATCGADPTQPMHAAGVEELARWLPGNPPTRNLERLLNAAARKQAQRARTTRHPRERSPFIYHPLTRIWQASTVISGSISTGPLPRGSKPGDSS